MKSKYEFFREKIGLTLADSQGQHTPEFASFLSKLETRRNLTNSLNEYKGKLILTKDKLENLSYREQVLLRRNLNPGEIIEEFDKIEKEEKLILQASTKTGNHSD